MSALGAAGWLVRESAAALVAIPWNVISGGLQSTGVKSAGHSIRSVSTAIDQRLEMHSGDGAVFLHTGFEFHQNWMTATVTIKDFLARQADLDGPVEHESGLGDDDFVMERIAFTTETAAVGRGDHPNMCGRHFQYLGERAMEIMRSLRAGPDGQLAIGILDGHRGMLLDGKMGVALEEKSVFEDFIGLSKPVFDVAELQRHELMNIAFFTVFVNPWLGGRQSFFGI